MRLTTDHDRPSRTPAAPSQGPPAAPAAHGRRPGRRPDGPSDGAPGDRLVGGVLLVAATLLFGVQLLAGHVIAPLAAFGVITLVLGGVLLRKRPRWLLVLAATVAVLYLGGGAPFMVANLAHPESPGSFLSEAFLLVAFLTVLAGVALRLWGSSHTARRGVVIAALAVAATATAGSLLTAATVDAEARQAGDVPIASERSVFPAHVELPAGEAVLWLDNRDAFHHTFVIDGADVHAVMPANSAVRVPIDLDPGTYRFWCDVPGHEAMEGVLDVR